MKRWPKYSVLLLLLLGACQDVIQVKLDKGAKLYVIDAFINDLREDQVIRVTISDAYFSNQEPPPVENAVVVVKDLTAGKDYSFAYAGSGNYVLKIAQQDTMGVLGHQYELNVTIDGMTYKALNVQRRKAGIDSIATEYVDPSQGGFAPPGALPYYVCTLAAKDKADDKPDYYWIKTFRNDSLLFSPTDINVSVDGTNGAVPYIGVDSLAFTPPVTFLGFRTFQAGNTCKVEIHSIARETYYFFVQAVAQVNNGGLFATTPENVKTNIVTPSAATKAVGWFDVSGVASRKVTIPN